MKTQSEKDTKKTTTDAKTTDLKKQDLKNVKGGMSVRANEPQFNGMPVDSGVNSNDSSMMGYNNNPIMIDDSAMDPNHR